MVCTEYCPYVHNSAMYKEMNMLHDEVNTVSNNFLNTRNLGAPPPFLRRKEIHSFVILIAQKGKG